MWTLWHFVYVISLHRSWFISNTSRGLVKQTEASCIDDKKFLGTLIAWSWTKQHVRLSSLLFFKRNTPFRNYFFWGPCVRISNPGPKSILITAFNHIWPRKGIIVRLWPPKIVSFEEGCISFFGKSASAKIARFCRI